MLNAAKKRLFLAINLPQNIKKELHKFSDKLAKKMPKRGIKMVEGDNLHITLYFLDSQNEKMIAKIIDLGKKTAENFKEFRASLGRLEIFPNKISPRVVVVNLEKGRGEAENLYKNLSRGLKNLGIFIDPRPWKGHLTLARIKFGRPNLKFLEKETVKSIEFSVPGFDLMESKLTPEGPIYKILQSFYFKK